MEFDWLWLLAAIWFVVNLISNARRKPVPPGRPKPAPPTRPNMPSRPEPRIVRSGADATQQEGSRLEQVLRNLQQTLEEAAQTEYRTTIQLPSDEEVEERASLEVEPEVRSLDEEVHREVRRRVDREEEVGDIEGRRVKAAAERDSARSRVDHAAFDQKIRQEAADHTATRPYTAKQLRDAIVWRELLGPPVSLREEERER
jgi:hypothetical protein